MIEQETHDVRVRPMDGFVEPRWCDTNVLANQLERASRLPAATTPDILALEVARTLDRLYVGLELCRTLERVFAGEDELGIGERDRDARLTSGTRHVHTEPGQSAGIAGAKLAEELLGSLTQLLQ